jgi:CheY-like chemotaxis protein
MANKVIIIEDEYASFEAIKKIIRGSFDCPQNYQMTDFTATGNKFLNLLRNSLCVNPTEIQKKNKLQLIQHLLSFCTEQDEPVYLIDYLLNGSNSDINGIEFKDIILKEMYPNKNIPVLFITSANGSNCVTVKKYVESKQKEGERIEWQPKPDVDKWNTVKDTVINSIRKFHSDERTTPALPSTEIV